MYFALAIRLTTASRHLVELVAIPGDARGPRHGARIQHRDHERGVGNAGPLAHETVVRPGFEPEPRVVLRVPDHDDERTVTFTQGIEAAPHELRANALTLAVRQHRHRPQTHSHDPPVGCLDHYRREEDVANDGVVLGNQ